MYAYAEYGQNVVSVVTIRTLRRHLSVSRRSTPMRVVSNVFIYENTKYICSNFTLNW